MPPVATNCILCNQPSVDHDELICLSCCDASVHPSCLEILQDPSNGEYICPSCHTFQQGDVGELSVILDELNSSVVPKSPRKFAAGIHAESSNTFSVSNELLTQQQEEIESQRRLIDSLRIEKEELSDAMNVLQAKCNKLDTEKTELQGEKDSLQSAHSSLKSIFDETRAEKKEIEAKLGNSELQQAWTTMSQEEKGSALEELQSKVQYFEGAMEEQEEEMENAFEDAARANKQVERLTTELEGAKAELTELNKKIETLKADRDSQSFSARASENALAAMKIKSTTQEQEITVMKQQLELTSSLEKELATSKQMNSEFAKSLETSKSRHEKELEELNNQWQQRCADAKKEAEDAFELKVAYDKAVAENSELAKQLEELKELAEQNAKAALQTNDDMTDMHKRERVRYGELSKLNATLQQQVIEAQRMQENAQMSQVSALQDLKLKHSELVDLAGQVKVISEENANLHQAKDILADENTQLRAVIAAMEQGSAAAGSKLGLSPEAQSLGTDSTGSDREAKLRKAVQAFKQCRAKLEDVEAEKSELEQKLQTMEKDRASLADQLAGLITDQVITSAVASSAMELKQQQENSNGNGTKELQSEEQSSEEELQVMKAHMESLKLEVQSLKSSLSEVTNAKEDIEASRDALQQILDDRDAEGDEAPDSARTAALEAQIEKLKGGMVKAREMCRSLASKNEEHEASIEEAEDKIATLSVDLEDSEASRKQLQDLVAKLKAGSGAGPVVGTELGAPTETVPIDSDETTPENKTEAEAEEQGEEAMLRAKLQKLMSVFKACKAKLKEVTTENEKLVSENGILREKSQSPSEKENDPTTETVAPVNKNEASTESSPSISPDDASLPKQIDNSETNKPPKPSLAPSVTTTLSIDPSTPKDATTLPKPPTTNTLTSSGITSTTLTTTAAPISAPAVDSHSTEHKKKFQAYIVLLKARIQLLDSAVNAREKYISLAKKHHDLADERAIKAETQVDDLTKQLAAASTPKKSAGFLGLFGSAKKDEWTPEEEKEAPPLPPLPPRPTPLELEPLPDLDQVGDLTQAAADADAGSKTRSASTGSSGPIMTPPPKNLFAQKPQASPAARYALAPGFGSPPSESGTSSQLPAGAMPAALMPSIPSAALPPSKPGKMMVPSMPATSPSSSSEGGTSENTAKNSSSGSAGRSNSQGSVGGVNEEVTVLKAEVSQLKAELKQAVDNLKKYEQEDEADQDADDNTLLRSIRQLRAKNAKLQKAVSTANARIRTLSRDNASAAPEIGSPVKTPTKLPVLPSSKPESEEELKKAQEALVALKLQSQQDKQALADSITELKAKLKNVITHRDELQKLVDTGAPAPDSSAAKNISLQDVAPPPSDTPSGQNSSLLPSSPSLQNDSGTKELRRLVQRLAHMLAALGRDVNDKRVMAIANEHSLQLDAKSLPDWAKLIFSALEGLDFRAQLASATQGQGRSQGGCLSIGCISKTFLSSVVMVLAAIATAISLETSII